jgi:hypothetical protein
MSSQEKGTPEERHIRIRRGSETGRRMDRQDEGTLREGGQADEEPTQAEEAYRESFMYVGGGARAQAPRWRPRGRLRRGR